MTAHFGVPFPQEARHELSYFQFRKAEQAARTVYQSLLLVLDFTEVSGEVPYFGRLAQLPALQRLHVNNSNKELIAMAEARGIKVGHFSNPRRACRR